MGEAKRRKQLDPSYGKKSRNGKYSFDNVKLVSASTSQLTEYATKELTQAIEQFKASDDFETSYRTVIFPFRLSIDAHLVLCDATNSVCNDLYGESIAAETTYIPHDGTFAVFLFSGVMPDAQREMAAGIAALALEKVVHEKRVHAQTDRT